MQKFEIYQIDLADQVNKDCAMQLYSLTYPENNERYSLERLDDELQNQSGWNYRTFFAANIGSQLVGIGAVKSADWASNTHIMYLGAVATEHRGMGIGTALERARIDWVKENFSSGRILVSTKHHRRFAKYGFDSISEIDGRYMMCLEF